MAIGLLLSQSTSQSVLATEAYQYQYYNSTLTLFNFRPSVPGRDGSLPSVSVQQSISCGARYEPNIMGCLCIWDKLEGPGMAET
jgi:hypothetical protein